MTRSPRRSPSDAMSSVCGASASSINAWPALRSARARVGPGLFPPELVVQIKALACELPATLGLPLSRLSTADIVREAQRSWHRRHASATRPSGGGCTKMRFGPWQHRTWIFPRDPEFAVKAGRILDLYARAVRRLPARRPMSSSSSADEKTSIQARLRCHPVDAAAAPPAPARRARVRARGAWAYLAALDVHRAKLFGRCERTTGIEPFQRLVTQVMTQSPYREARRVFWILDNGSSHRGAACVQRLQTRRFPISIAVHGPDSRQLAQPNRNLFLDPPAQGADAERFPARSPTSRSGCWRSRRYYESIATPFEWRFTKDDLAALMRKLDSRRVRAGRRRVAEYVAELID